jgi:hypothetical protein
MLLNKLHVLCALGVQERVLIITVQLASASKATHNVESVRLGQPDIGVMAPPEEDPR